MDHKRRCQQQRQQTLRKKVRCRVAAAAAPRTIDVVQVGAEETGAEPTIYTLRERQGGVWSVEERCGGAEAKPRRWPALFASAEDLRVILFGRAHRQARADTEADGHHGDQPLGSPQAAELGP